MPKSLTLRLLPLALLAASGVLMAQGAAPLPRGSEHGMPGTSTPAGETLSADLFYRLLLGDVAMQRGEPGVAARAYLDAAREANDARLARRATEIAIVSRQRTLAQDAAKLWSTLDPAAERPRQILAALAAGTPERDLPGAGASEELRGRLERLLAEAAVNGQGVGDIFLQLNRLFAQQSDKRGVYILIRDLGQPYPKSAEAHFAIALAAYNVGPADAALAGIARSEAEKVLELRPDWERAALLYSEVLAKSSPDAAIAYLQKFTLAQPTAKAAAGGLAQLYVEARRFVEARAVMQRLWDREPESRDLEFGVAAVALQMKDYPEAERLLLDLKQAGYGETGAMDYYLAQLAEENKRYADALARYQAITEGERAWAAKLRVGNMYGKLKRLDEAAKWYGALSPTSSEERVQLVQAQAQAFRDGGNEAQAYAVLNGALTEQPDSTDLLYDVAMVAERLDRIDEAEQRLKRLVELKPNDAQALNALGYTLVDRTPRTTEGYALIEKAHQLAPRDPFILDSLGWALFRMGRLDEAEGFLKRALEQRPDAEIAAHLGEVLWQKGDRASALALWQAQLEANPDNAVLNETMRRLSR